MSVTVNPTWNADQKKNLQKMLNNYGFTDNNGNALAVDGVIGSKTQQALAKMNTYQQHLNKPDSSIAAWQAQLNDWGYKDANGLPLKEDGIFGPKTDTATSEFENGFFDGFTGRANQKKTVPTQKFPTMPKASDSQIQAAITSIRKNTNSIDWGQAAHSGIGNQTQSPFTAAAQKPVQAQNGGLTPHQSNEAQTTNATGQAGTNLLDMVLGMQKILKEKPAAELDPGFTVGSGTTAEQDPGFKPWNKAFNGQDSRYANESSTAIINKTFNGHNRSAGLDKSKVAFLSSAIKDENKDDPFYEALEGISDIYKDTTKTVTAPVAKIIGDYLKDPKNADNVKAMQEQLSKNFQGVLKVFGMRYDKEKGMWYSDDKGIQQYGGYADFYDLLTPLLGFDVETDKVGFDYGDKHYVFRPWFGNYGMYSLVPGAENGIYENDRNSTDGSNQDNDHYRIDQATQDKRVRMNIQLYDDKGNQIMTVDDHNQDRYWQFGSNMMAGGIDKDNLYMEATLTSDDKGFLETLANEGNKNNNFKFGGVIAIRDPKHKDQYKYTVTYTYDPNGILKKQRSGSGYAAGGYGGGGGRAW